MQKASKDLRAASLMCSDSSIKIPLQTFNKHSHIDVSVDSPAIPTLADVLWLVDDEGDSYTKFR